MRQLVLAWLACFIVTGAASAQASGQNDAWANKIFAPITSKDFGTVAKGAQLKYSFKMTNIYKVPLEITNTRVTCGCVTVTPSTKTLEPNETGYLHVNMDGRRFSGSKKIDIFVTVGPQFISTANLTVSATTRQDVVLNPGEIEFGVIQRGSTPSHFIDVEYAGALDWRITEIVKNGTAPFDLRVEELMRQNAQQVRRITYRLHATLKPDSQAGSFKEEILLKTNDPSSPVLTFNINGNVQASLTAAPSLVTMNTLRVSEIQEKKVVIRGSRPFQITKIDGQGQGVTAFAADRTSSTHVLTIRCRMDQAAEVRKNLVIHTTLDNETVNVVVEARAIP
jgi:hypothetical protein